MIENPFCFSFGGLTLRLAYSGISLEAWPNPYYVPFRSQLPSDIEICVERAASLPKVPEPNKLRFDGQHYWRLYEVSEGYFMELFDPKTHLYNRSVHIDRNFSSAQIVVSKETWYFNDFLRPLGEILVTHYLSKRSGFLLHGAAIRDGNRAYLFIGESGAGKTTMSRLWAKQIGDFSVLGDERIIVRQDVDGWHVYGTPWPGMGFMVSNQRIPISQVFFISHGKKNEAIDAPRVLLFNHLFSQVFSPFWNREALECISTTCEKLVSTVPSFLLPFLNDDSIIPYVRNFVHRKARQTDVAFA